MIELNATIKKLSMNCKGKRAWGDSLPGNIQVPARRGGIVLASHWRRRWRGSKGVVRCGRRRQRSSKSRSKLLTGASAAKKNERAGVRSRELMAAQPLREEGSMGGEL